MRHVLGSPGLPLRRARTTSSTDAAFAAPVATTTKPSGAGVIDFSADPPVWLRVFPFGAGANNDTFVVRVLGWSLVSGLWVPTILCQFSVTLSQFVGVAGSDVTDTERFCDTVGDPVANFGEKGVTCQPYSPQNDTPGFMLLDFSGCTLVEVQFDMVTATSGNALVGPG